jgi:hypothetical protein
MNITIPANPQSRIRIPAKAAQPKPQDQTENKIERIGYSVRETMESLGICKATVFSLIKQGKIRTITIGKRRIISVQSLRDFVDGKKEPCDSRKE